MIIKTSQLTYTYPVVLFFLGLFFVTGAAQTNTPPATTGGDNLLIFGPPIEGKPNTYAFNDRYFVEVEKKGDGRIVSIFLGRNEDAPRFTKLTKAEMRDFYRKVKVIGDIGKPLFAALWTGGNFYEYLYEYGKIDKSFKEGDDDRVFTSQINVLFPYKVSGKVSRVDGAGPVTSIKIGKCYYYCFTRGVRRDDTGDFMVIGPNNGLNGQCNELNLKA